MFGLLRKVSLIGACSLLSAGLAFASVPSPGNSSIPNVIPLAGVKVVAGAVAATPVPSPGKSVTITVRDFSNNPIPGAIVEVDFSGCVDGFVCQVNAGGGQFACTGGGGKVFATADGAGQVNLTVLGAANNSGLGVTGAAVPCVQIRADGVVLGTSKFVAYDQNGALPFGNGVSGVDLAIASGDVIRYLAGGPFLIRSDYDDDDILSGVDLSVLLGEVLNQFSINGCDNGNGPQAYCP